MLTQFYSRLFVLFFCLIQLNEGFSQNPSRIIHQKWEGGPLYTLAQYQGDLTTNGFKGFNSGFGLLVRRHLDDNFSLRTTLYQAKLTGSDQNVARLQTRGFSFHSPVTDLNFLGEYDFLGKRRYKNHYFHKIISPYIALGTGVTFIKPTTNYNEAANEMIIERIQEDKSPENKQNIILSLNYGFGVKIDVNNGWAINIDISKRLPFTDKIDGVKMSGNPNKNDSYCFNSLGLIYRFRKKNDKDRDGVADIDDFCPNKYGNPDLHGCPDRDGDLVPDKDDLCPNQSGDRNLGGCPLPKPSYEVEIAKQLNKL